MRTRVLWSVAGIAIFVLVFSVAGCGDEPPPFDELPLRDALRAQPDIIAALSDASRQRLAARLEAERVRDTSLEQVLLDEAATPGTRLVAVDVAREKARREPLMVGAISDGIVRPLSETVVAAAATPVALPLLEVPADAAITPAESRALAGAAAPLLRALLTSSGAVRLRRVAGWPTGAVAIGDTVYVNGAWLVALAPSAAMAPDAGRDQDTPQGATASASVASVPAVPSNPSSVPDGGTDLTATTDEILRRSSAVSTTVMPDGGVTVPPTDPDPPPPVDTTDSCASFLDACGEVSYACSQSDNSGDSCGGSSGAGDDSCGGFPDDGSDDACTSPPDDGSDDACAAPPDDGSDTACSSPPDDGSASSCQITRGPARRGPGTIVGLFMPLAFLLLRRRQ